MLDPGLKPLESDTLKAAAPQNVNDRTYTTACNITVREKDGLSRNQPTRFPIILFNPWITVTQSRLVVKSSSISCLTSSLISYLQAFLCLSISPFLFSFPPRKAWYSNYFIFTQRFRATKCLSKSIKFSGILLILILVVSFVCKWTRRNFRLLGESLRGNKTKWQIYCIATRLVAQQKILLKNPEVNGRDHFFLYFRVQKLCSRSSEDLSWPVRKFLRSFILEIAKFVPSIFSQNYKTCLPCECW